MGIFSICLFVPPSVCSPPLGHPARTEAQPARPEAQPARSEAQPARSEAQPAKLQAGWPGGGNGQTDRQTNRKSLHSTGLCPLSGPLPWFPSCKPRKCIFKIKVRQGKGIANLLMPFGYLFQLKCFFSHEFSTKISQPVINLKFPC